MHRPNANSKDVLQDVSSESASSYINNNSTTSSRSGSQLMNGNGDIIYRRSPVSSGSTSTMQSVSPMMMMMQQAHQQFSSTSGTQNVTPHHHLNQLQAHNFYTLGSPSITTSYNSDENSETKSALELDENVGDLTTKFDQLQRQVEELSRTQETQDERYRRSKQENEDLLNRIHSLEDQLRELEINAEIRAQEDEKRFKETMAKQMKLKAQECEQQLNTNYALQQEIISLQKELLKAETLIRTLRNEKDILEADLQEKNSELVELDAEVHKLKLKVKHLKDEENVKSNLINILNEELEDNQHRSQRDSSHRHQNNSSLHQHNLNTSSISSQGDPDPNGFIAKQQSVSSRRSSCTSGLGDDLTNSGCVNQKALRDIDILESNLAKIKEENQRLKETNEELQAQLLNVQLEEGRSLIQEGNKSYSLADEMGDIDVQKLMQALKEQQDDNARLRNYMDDILSRIVEKSPELLDKTTIASPATKLQTKTVR